MKGNEEMNANKPKENGAIRHRILTVVGAVLCIILIPILVLNVTLIVKSYTSDDVPTVKGWYPMIVLTDSMSPVFNSGDLVIGHSEAAEDVKVDDVISFFDPDGSGTSVVTHRVIEIVNEDGELFFRTKGDANNTEDKSLVPAESLIGVYKLHVAGVGNVAMFMQTTAGLVVCVVLPLILLVGYDLIRRKKYDATRQQDTNALLAELEALKAEKEKTANAATVGSEKNGGDDNASSES